MGVVVLVSTSRLELGRYQSLSTPFYPAYHMRCIGNLPYFQPQLTSQRLASQVEKLVSYQNGADC
jgi:hypothetical protein